MVLYKWNYVSLHHDSTLSEMFLLRGRLLNNNDLAILLMQSQRAINWYKKFHIWRKRHLADQSFVMVLSIIVGLGSGLAAVLLKTIVHEVGRALVKIGIHTWVGGNALMLLYPAIGILLTILFVKYVVKGNIGHGIPEVLYAVARKKSILPSRNMYSSLIASTLTVAFGGSVGLEAPIASTGSAIGSNFARWMRLGTAHTKLLLGCGAAGAIAGIFKAPIAGIWFVVEVFMLDLTATSAIPLLLASLSAASMAYFFMGTDVQFAFTVDEVFALGQIPYFVILGVVCAFSSVYFLRVTDFVESRLKKISSTYVRMLLGGVILGVLIFLFPPLFGEGYGTLTSLLHGDTSVLFANSIFQPWESSPWAVIVMIFVLVAFKVIATSVTIGSGGVGGTFGPSLIVGGLSGYFVALILNTLGIADISEANFALVGMAAVMTGVMHAPFMATFLIAEITGGYALLVPLLLSSAITYICVNPFEKHSIYARKLARHGDLMTHDKDSSAWQLMNMRSLIETNFVVVREGDTLRQLVEAIQISKRNIFPVLTSDDKFLGVIALDDVRKIIFRPELYDSYKVEDLMYPLSEGDVVRLEDPPQDVVAKFQISNRYNLIVIDKDDNYIGFLSRANTFSAYRRFVSAISEE